MSEFVSWPWTSPSAAPSGLRAVDVTLRRNSLTWTSHESPAWQQQVGLVVSYGESPSLPTDKWTMESLVEEASHAARADSTSRVFASAGGPWFNAWIIEPLFPLA
ncbi:hypothetical protein VCV18_002379 [Metarhizium anisopliae]